MSSLEAMIVLFLLIDTSYACNFVPFYQLYVAPTQITFSIVAQAVSGWVTDNTDSQAHTVLLVTAITACFLDPLLFFLSKNSVWVVLIFFVLRYGTIIQIGNSTGKILKMRLKKIAMPEDQQVHVFNNTFILSDLGGRLSIVIFGYALGALLIRLGNADFGTIKMVLFGVVVFWDIVTLIMALSFHPVYFQNWYDSDVTENTSLVDDINGELPEESLVPNTKPSNPLTQIKNSAVEFYQNKFLFQLTIHLTVNALVMAWTTIILRFAISNQDVTEPQLRENFCGGMFANILELQAVTEAVRLGGAVVFQLLMSKMRPYHYFKVLYPIVMGLLVVAIGVMFVPIGPHAGSVLVALLNVIIYLITNYDNVIIGVVCPPEIVGFVFAAEGVFLQLVGLIPSFLSQLDIPTWGFTLILLVYTIVLFIFHFYLTRANRVEIVALDDKSKNTGERTCLERALLGYT